MNPETNLFSATMMLQALWNSIQFSPVYRTAPIGFEKQDDFYNAVGLFTTKLSPKEIQSYLKVIEQRLKKNPPQPMGPRTIDLDILLYDDLVTEENGLSIPHPRMHERRFVLEPLLTLIPPEEQHPKLQKTWQELFDATLDQKCTYVDLRL